jgi:hypothetical protein
VPKGYVPRVGAPPPRTAPPRPESAYETKITFDDPEDADWFRRLPKEAQEDMRRRWAEDDVRNARRGILAKTTRERSMTQAAVLFFLVETGIAIPSVLHSLAAIAVGAAVGFHWHRAAAGRFLCMTTCVLPFLVLRAVFGAIDSRDQPEATAVLAAAGLAVLLTLTAVVGFLRERRRDDDVEY